MRERRRRPTRSGNGPRPPARRIRKWLVPCSTPSPGPRRGNLSPVTPVSYPVNDGGARSDTNAKPFTNEWVSGTAGSSGARLDRTRVRSQRHRHRSEGVATLHPSELRDAVSDGRIDTVVCAFPDLYGRLLGKR